MFSVLVVDDEPLMRASLKLAIEADPNFKLLGEAAEGKAAIQLASAGKPDVALLDITMPGMDGIDALPRLLELGCQVVMISSHPAEEIASRVLNDGAQGYIEKTLDAPEILSRLLSIMTGCAS